MFPFCFKLHHFFSTSGVQFWTEIILVISNWTRAACSSDFEVTCMTSDLIIYMKKFLDCDWLTEMQFLGNRVQKEGNWVQKKGNLLQKKVTNVTFWLANKQRNSLGANQMRHLKGAKFGSAPDQFRAKAAMVGVCSTFAFATETTVEELKNCSKNENTGKSAGFWLSVWKNWCVDNESTDEIENYEPAELDTLLKHFYAEIKRWRLWTRKP